MDFSARGSVRPQARGDRRVGRFGDRRRRGALPSRHSPNRSCAVRPAKRTRRTASCWTSYQSRMTAKRWNRSTFSSLAGERDLIDHARRLRLGENLRRVLRIDQHHIGAGRFEFLDAFVQFGRMRRRADDRAAPNWCRPARARVADARRSRRWRTAPSCLAVSSPLTPRLSTVMSCPGKSFLSSTASRLG